MVTATAVDVAPRRRVSFWLDFSTPPHVAWDSMVSRRTRVRFAPGFAESAGSVAGQLVTGIIAEARPELPTGRVWFAVDLDPPW